MKIENELYESVLVDGRFFDLKKMENLTLEQQRQMLRYAVDNRDSEPNGASENLMDCYIPYIKAVLVESLGAINASDGDTVYFEDIIAHLLSSYLRFNPDQKWSLENAIGCYTDNNDTKKYTGLSIPIKWPIKTRLKMWWTSFKYRRFGISGGK